MSAWVKWIVVALCVSILSALITTMIVYVKKYYQLKVDYEILAQQLEQQNSKIKNLEIDTQQYVKEIEEKDKRIAAKYDVSRYNNKIIKQERDLNACNAKLTEIQQLILVFNNQ